MALRPRRLSVEGDGHRGLSCSRTAPRQESRDAPPGSPGWPAHAHQQEAAAHSLPWRRRSTITT